MKFVSAVKIYHQRNGSKYKVPRKNTPEYDAVRKIMLEGGPAPTKSKNVNMEVKPAVVNKVVSEILEDIEMSKASEMVKNILSKHMKEAKREIIDTFQGEGINDLLRMIPESIASQKDINQVKGNIENISKGNISVPELKKSWKNIKTAVTKIDGLVKKGVKQGQTAKGLSQLGGNIFNDIVSFIKPLIPVLAPVANIPEIKNITQDNVVKVWGQVKDAIKEVDTKVKKTLTGKGLKQLGNGDQKGGFLPLLLALIPTITSALSAAAAAAATGAATYAGAKAAEAIGKAL